MEDIIITVLAVAVGLAFKVIEKRLKSAGKTKPKEQSDWTKQLSEMFGSEESEVSPTVVSEEETVEPVYVKEPVSDAVASEEAPRAVIPEDSQILVEETQEKKEMIDPKKLVVYSEIMKPKYLD